MSQELIILSYSALAIGFLHTLLGPDHYIPFVAMAKAGKWSRQKTIWVTVVSGVGHVLGSIILGAVGIAIGLTLNIVAEIESYREILAGWVLISFGIIYFLWAVKRLVKNMHHTHVHTHSDGTIHSHVHHHNQKHAHAHESKTNSNLTTWVLFVIFVLGPCESLIPLLIYPAANISVSGVVIVVSLFATSTILTMLTIVLISLYSIDFIPFTKFEKYSHVFAGLIVIISGVGIQLLGL